MIDRKAVYNKYGGRCAYCGRRIEFKEMQVDHLIPQWRFNEGWETGDMNDPKNLMPTCRTCNHYKRRNSLNDFRHAVATIPCKLAKRQYIYKVGMAYGFYDGEERKIRFHFEEEER